MIVMMNEYRTKQPLLIHSYVAVAYISHVSNQHVFLHYYNYYIILQYFIIMYNYNNYTLYIILIITILQFIEITIK